MNRQAVALAADSAVTIETEEGGRKAWQSAIKIFGMSIRHPVGILIYGNADLLGVPWDTVIKGYRDQLGETSFPTISAYADDFVHFVESNRRFFPPDLQTSWFEAVVAGDFRKIVEEIADRLRRDHPPGTPLTLSDIQSVVTGAVDDRLKEREAMDRLPHVTDADLERLGRKYAPVITRLRREIFQHLPLTSASSRKLRRLAQVLFGREIFSRSMTGVVVAGFGDDEHFPALDHIAIDGIANNRLNYARAPSSPISQANGAEVRAFAQQEMVFQFMEGVDQRYQGVVEEVIDSIVQELPGSVIDNIPRMSKKRREALKASFAQSAPQVSAAFREGLEAVRQAHYATPVVQVVAVLPKDELAAMAEALVNLTAVRRRLSFQVESVGGPIDVALVSKGDGFVWIKRKNYFDMTRNPHFMARYLH
jgi:hypothetical protein